MDEQEDVGVEQQDVDNTQEEVESPEPQAAEPAPPPPQQAPNPWGVMENFRRLPQFQGRSEQEIAQGLYLSMQREQAAARHLAQYQQVMPIAQQYLADRPQYEEWLKTRNQPQAPVQQAPAPEKKGWWNPPEVREAYKQYLVKDENGREVISPDAPLDARHALAELQSYKANFAKEFLSDPEKALGPMIEARSKEIAQQAIQQQLQARDNESFVDSIQAENQDWLFDEQGNVTPEGLSVHKYVEEARALGIASPQARWQYARDKVEYGLLLRDFEQRQAQAQAPQYQQQAQPQPPAPQYQPPAPPPQADQRAAIAQQNMEYLRREASRSPSRSAGTTHNDPRAPKPKMSFEQMLAANAESKGFI
jgi:hypothetical protein